MINIGIDNYLSFNSIKKIYHSNKNDFFKIPVSKKMIFNSNLDIFQKKNFLENLNKIQKFVQFQYKEQKNVNSIKDLEKEIYKIPENEKIFLELSKNLKNNHSELFKILYKNENKFFEGILRYSLISRRKIKNEDDLDLENFLRKFKDFVKSMGVHAVYPYLYPIYGIGDVSQVFTRISALHNSIFLLNEDFEIFSFSKNSLKNEKIEEKKKKKSKIQKKKKKKKKIQKKIKKKKIIKK